ncbi:ribonuclease T [Hydrogenovibrio sp. JE_KL2]|uniref:ribonuclease T n=1 Tax=Hydrogenovibrio sp. JE_KL2 TaxID=2651188 RepID=UPI00128D8427|nr:ribonuclease T [Hydrogenovibrio sp. JE_KL2]MPQ75599.1 ribonuclease T [Hydrogenovibrio sp. JE_KL2]
MRPVTLIKDRFRGFLPVVVDVETAGFDPQTNALIEIAVVTLKMNEDGLLEKDQTIQANVLPFRGSKLDPGALKFIGVEDPTHPFRMAVSEKDALEKCFAPIRKLLKDQDCSRAILIGHNAFFDLSFVKAASERCKIKSPFHEFSTFDTVSLSGLVYGQTVLAKAVTEAGIDWEDSKAHSAEYDTEKTAELFCKIVNQWPLQMPDNTLS